MGKCLAQKFVLAGWPPHFDGGRHQRRLDRPVLEGLKMEGVFRVLFRTRNSSLLQGRDFTSDHAYVSADGAKFVVDGGIKLVGIDYLSVAQYRGPGSLTQRILLTGVVIVEGLDVSGAPPGDYKLPCALLSLRGADGASARVFLWEIQPRRG